MKFQVVGTVTFNFDLDIEAASEEEAIAMVEAKDYADLVEHAHMPAVEVDGVTEMGDEVEKDDGN